MTWGGKLLNSEEGEARKLEAVEDKTGREGMDAFRRRFGGSGCGFNPPTMPSNSASVRISFLISVWVMFVILLAKQHYAAP